jgi:hypothetical protein
MDRLKSGEFVDIFSLEKSKTIDNLLGILKLRINNFYPCFLPFL